jgi:uncharacterized membrane protein
MGTGLEMEAARGRKANGHVGTALGQAARPRTTTTTPYQRIADEDRGTGGSSLADFLGYFSIGLGLAELIAPNAMSRLIGVREPDETNRRTMQMMGLRELSNGVAILASQQPATAMWSRVAGDTLDLALLGRTLANPENDRGRTLFATANVLAVTALDVMCARELSRQPKGTPQQRAAKQGIIRTRRSVTVRRPVAEVYAFWRNFENFPQFMRHLLTVTDLGDGRSHWVAKGPAGREFQWEAVITEERENELIAWRSTEGADVSNRGEVSFRAAPGGRGTEVRVELEYDPPMGKLGSKVAQLWREEPGQQVADDLRHFKQVMEIGEIVFSDATKQRGMHPAQPNEKPVQL